MTILPCSASCPLQPVPTGVTSSLWACVRDATTLRDLAALRRTRPTDWHLKMHQAAQRVGASATVAEALRVGGQGVLLPESASDREANRLKKVRHCARRLVEAYGDVRLSGIDERWLLRERRGAYWRDACSKDVAGACFTLLRKLVYRAAIVDRHRPRVRSRLRPLRRSPIDAEPPRRTVARWGDVELLIAHAEPRVRAAVVLQAHIGASPGRVLELRVGDLFLQDGAVRVWVPGPGDRLEPVYYALPPDAVRALRPWLRRRARLGSEALLFPMRGAPTRPTRSLGKALRRETRRLGLPPVTLQEVQRLARAGLRDMGGTWAQVRGSKRVRPTLRRPSPKLLARHRQGWSFQQGAGDVEVPLRAPRHCGADQPEQGRRSKRGREGAWPVTPVVRNAKPPGEPGPRARVDPAPAMVLPREVEPTRTNEWPVPGLALAENVPTAASTHTTVLVRGYTQDELMTVFQQGVSAGVGLSEWGRTRG